MPSCGSPHLRNLTVAKSAAQEQEVVGDEFSARSVLQTQKKGFVRNLTYKIETKIKKT